MSFGPRKAVQDPWTDVPLFIRGLLLGFAIAAPVGPIGVLCIRRTLAEGRLMGLLSGLGAATADMLYGAIAAFGLTAVHGWLVGQQFWLQLVGSGFLLYLGVRTFLIPLTDPIAEEAKPRSRWGAYLTTFALTIMNPATILSFTLIFAGFRLAGSEHGLGNTALLVLGVFLGSAAWWLLLSSVVGLLSDRFSPLWMRWVNRIAGGLIFAFGVAALVWR